MVARRDSGCACVIGVRAMGRCGVLQGAGLVLGLACLGVSAARAQATSPAPTSAETSPPASAADPAESPEYRSLIDAALEEFARGNWTEAYALFLRAHVLSPSARTLRGLAVCAFEAKQYLRAIEYMRAALADTRKALDDKQRGEASSLIDRAQVFVARLGVTVEPVQARVEVDGALATRDAQDRVLLDPGVHQLTLSLPGYLTETRSVSVSPGDELRLVVQITPAPLPGVAVTSTESSRPTPTAAPQAPLSATPDATTQRTWAWVSAAGSLVLAGAGTTMFVLVKDGVHDIGQVCPRDACTAREIERRIDERKLDTLQVGSILAFALAGASAVVSTILFATLSDDRPPSTDAAAPATLRVRF
jgi:hypothetical protein